jgi:hypothetical protein
MEASGMGAPATAQRDGNGDGQGDGFGQGALDISAITATLESLRGGQCQGSSEFPGCDHGNSPPCCGPVRAGRSAAMASRWRRMR